MDKSDKVTSTSVMFDLPFSAEQLFAIFARIRHNDGNLIWVLSMMSVVPVFAAMWPSPRRLKAGLIVLSLYWGISGGFFHGVLFSEINPAAYGFAALFMVQAVLLLLTGVFGTVREAGSGTRTLGVAMMIGAIAIYPVLVMALNVPVPPFGIAPCPVTLVTLGYLTTLANFGRPLLLAIPVGWSLIGGLASFLLEMPADALLWIYSAITGTILFWDRGMPRND